MLFYDDNKKKNYIDRYSYDRQFLNSNEIYSRNEFSKVSETPGIKLILLAKYFETTFFNKRNSICDDSTGWYVTALKVLIRESSGEELSQLYDAKTKNFPILDILMNYSHHQDVMIRNAARLSILIIFKRCRGEVLDYIEEFVIPLHFVSIAQTLKLNTKGCSNQQENASLKCFYHRYCEELEYVDDILSLSNIKFNDRIRRILLETLITPGLWSFAEGIKDEMASAKSVKISFASLGTFLVSVNDQVLREIICSFFRTGEFSHAELINGVESKQRREMIKHTIKRVFSRKDYWSCMPSVMGLISIVVKHYVSNNQWEYLLYVYKSYAKPVFHYFTKKVKSFCDSQDSTLDLIVLFLEPMLRVNIWSGSVNGLELRKYFLGLILNFYLSLCNEMKSQLDSNVISLIDTEYKIFLEGKQKRKNYVQTFSDSIEACSILGNLSTSKKCRLRAALKKVIRLRHLYLFANSRKEEVLPFLPNKMTIGQTTELVNSLPCSRLIHNQSYCSHHYLKFAASHVAVLQRMESTAEGVVIFSAYYVDLKCSKLTNNELQLNDYSGYETFRNDSSSTPLFIQIRFQYASTCETVVNTLWEARQKQCKMLKRKMRSLLKMEF